MKKNSRFLLKALLMGLTFIFLLSCGTIGGIVRSIKKDDITLDPTFSVNLATPQKNLPNKKRISEPEKKAYAEYGRPDYIRIWWNKKGKIVSHKELGDMMKRQKSNFNTFRKSWIYTDEGKEKEVLFAPDGTYKSLPLSDKLKIVADNGDPQNIMINNNASYDERWTYYTQGFHYYFFEDKKIKEQKFEPMGGTFTRD